MRPLTEDEKIDRAAARVRHQVAEGSGSNEAVYDDLLRQGFSPREADAAIRKIQDAAYEDMLQSQMQSE